MKKRSLPAARSWVVRCATLFIVATAACLSIGAGAEPISDRFDVPQGVPANMPKPPAALPQRLAADGVDVNVSNLLGNEAEASISINPNDPNTLVIAGHSPDGGTLNTFYSNDGGASWTLVALGDAEDGFAGFVRTDPTVTYDTFGNIYVGYGVIFALDAELHLALVVAKSTDGGASYSQFTVVDQAPLNYLPGLLEGNDKWLLATALRPTLPAVPDVYIAWTKSIQEDESADQQIVVSRSSDGGLTFSSPLVINDASIAGQQEGNFGAVPAVGPNGEVYVAWHNSETDEVLVDVSFDGGLSFGTDRLATTSATGFKTRIPADPSRGVFTGPVIDIDRSGGPYTGRLHLTYTDIAAGGLPDVNVLTRFSDDHGASWSAPLRVHDDVGTNSQFLPWLDVDQVTGLVSVLWYDARNDVGNEQVEVFAAVSDDGGETFLPNILVSDGASNQSASNPQASDSGYLEYIGVAVSDCSVHAVWSDNSTDPADLDFFTDKVPITLSDTTLCAPRRLEVDPPFLDFPAVEVGTTASQILELVNVGEGPIHVREIETVAPSAGFSIMSAPAVPFTLEADETAAIEVAFSPLVAGFEVGTLLVDNNASGVAISLYGEAVASAPGIKGVLDFFDVAVAEGTLVGFDFSDRRLALLHRFLVAAARRVESDRPRAGCGLLRIAYRRSDGQNRPRDLVMGPAAPVLAAMIHELIEERGCRLP